MLRPTMIAVHTLHIPSDPPLAAALAAFEAQFLYPLGPDRHFRISHGEDYARFFRAMGEARCFVAEDGGCVLGTLGVSLRELVTGGGTTHRAAYIGDLKIAPAARGGRVLHRLARAAYEWAHSRATCAFGVVMDGTAALPGEYTGRAGVPGFEKARELVIDRISSDTGAADACVTLPAGEGRALYESLGRGRAFATGGDASERSEIAPEWIATVDSTACGRLEDTRRAKRLLVDEAGGGATELRSAHLACFAWRTPAGAAAVVSAARRRAARLGLPAVFVAVDAADAGVLDAAAHESLMARAGATIYGVNLPGGLRWVVSSSEV